MSPKREVLSILEQDARTPPEKIAQMTGLSEMEVRRIIKEAEDTGAILRYKTIIDWEKAGRQEVWALIEVDVVPQREVGFDSLAERIARHSEVDSVYLVSGQYDLAVLVVGNSMREVASFVSEKLATLEGIRGTSTHFLLKRYKEDGELLHETKDVRRLPLSL